MTERIRRFLFLLELVGKAEKLRDVVFWRSGSKRIDSFGIHFSKETVIHFGIRRSNPNDHLGLCVLPNSYTGCRLNLICHSQFTNPLAIL